MGEPQTDALAEWLPLAECVRSCLQQEHPKEQIDVDLKVIILIGKKTGTL